MFSSYMYKRMHFYEVHTTGQCDHTYSKDIDCLATERPTRQTPYRTNYLPEEDPIRIRVYKTNTAQDEDTT